MKCLLSSSYVLMFDNYYSFQPRLKSLCKTIDLSNISSTRYMCSTNTLEMISDKIKNIKNSLCFLGSGDFHHFTLLLLKNISQKISLIVFDKHVDYSNFFEGFVSCGSWLKDACDLENVAEVFVLSEEKKNVENQKLKIALPSEYRKIQPRFDIYISIDKDILSSSSLKTTWDQGSCDVATLFEILSYFASKYTIIGSDVCGEPPVNFFSPEHKKSEDINLRLLSFFTTSLQLLAG
ncbi:hypothetical protein ELD05_11515 [Caldicellulosiruptor changbaiensis]|uniref:Arginase n=1 Tax=Caldicellulosiruptor changbaiensis TaxID=1222016 RepID=A0A3T0D7U6_9FIRM|nr:hypothetical protein [Caldicellulosiruptor changbaiensis]AZT91207.1 hypothetical protein ELD05_11515 [Caldicellulosiruptor changbaiensis]